MIDVRKQIQDILEKLPNSFYFHASQKIVNTILKSTIFLSSKNIACYIPIEYEVAIWDIIKNIWLQGKNCYLPVFDLAGDLQLKFIRFFENDELIVTEHKIPEPLKYFNSKNSSIAFIKPENLDLVIIPLIGFNKDNFRLGRKKGCYDRTFSFKQQKHALKPYLLGVGYECQRVSFEPKSWDVPMNAVVTEVVDEVFVALSSYKE
jgi:5-formyltetrahydrofolate cyclo-ligase